VSFDVPTLLLTFQVLSILLHIIFNIKTYIYKRNLLRSEKVVTGIVSQYKQESISSIENRLMSDKATNAINAVIVGSVVSVSHVVNSFDPSLFLEFPNYMVLYFYQLILPFLTIGTVTLVYYLRHAPLRKAIIREI
jgi:hypothetical protein